MLQIILKEIIEEKLMQKKTILSRIMQIKPLFYVSQVLGVVVFSVGMSIIVSYLTGRKEFALFIIDSQPLPLIIGILFSLVGIIFFLFARQILILHGRLNKHENKNIKD